MFKWGIIPHWADDRFIASGPPQQLERCGRADENG